MVDGTWNTSIEESLKGRRNPFIRRGDSAYVIVEGPTWKEAEANANALGGHLVTINDADEDMFLTKSFFWATGSDYQTMVRRTFFLRNKCHRFKRWDDYQPDKMMEFSIMGGTCG